MKRGVAFILAVAVLLSLAGTAKADGFKLAAPALSGDVVYDLRESELGYGPSYTLGNLGYDQMVAIKGMWVIYPDTEVSNKLGAGLALSVPKALKAIGVKNIPDWFTLEIGVLGLIDFSDKPEGAVGLYATLLRIPL